MARPIEATPTLYGEDAERLLEDLKHVCSPEEMKRRIAQAKVIRAEMMRPKTAQGRTHAGVKEPKMKNTKLSDIRLQSIGNTVQMTGAIYAGEGHTYLCFFPGDTLEGEPEILDMPSEDWQTFLRQTDLMETEVLTKAKDGTLVKAIARKSNRQIDQGVSWGVYKRDEYRCRYCGADDVPLTVDHLVRWELGGPSTEANLVSACRKCNKVRGDTEYADWLQHPHYARVSKNLTPTVRAANEALLPTLANIPRVIHVKSR